MKKQGQFFRAMHMRRNASTIAILTAWFLIGGIFPVSSNNYQDADDYCGNGHLVERATSDVEWSRDGSKLAVASYAVDIAQCIVDVQVQVFDGVTDLLIASLQHGDADVTGLAWNPENTRLATADYAGVVRIWDITTGTETDTYQLSDVAILEVSWSANGTLLATGGFDNVIRVVDTVSGSVPGSIDLGSPTLPGLSDAIVWLDWSPDGSQLGSGGIDGVIQIRDATTSTILRTIQANNDTSANASWSPNGNRLASNSDGNDVQIWDAQTGQLVLSLQGHTDHVNGTAWSPDGAYLASTSRDGTVRIWDSTTGQQVNLIGPSPDGGETLHLDWGANGKLAYGSLTYVDDNDPGASPLSIITPLPPSLSPTATIPPTPMP